jgi:Tol biopolymer transport system component
VHQPNETHAIHRGGQRRTILVALVTIAFVAVAIVKPWGGSVPTSALRASPTVVARAQASTLDTPQSPGPVGHLAYGLDGDIFVADWDGRNPVRIADGAPGFGPAACGSDWGDGPMWSPDGRHFAYRSASGDRCGGTVVISDLETKSVASFLSTGWLVSWSPDSTRVASWVDLFKTIGIYGFDGERQALLSVPPGYGVPGDFDPVWSPDGRSLLIELGSPAASTVEPQVWEIPIDGSAARPVPAGDPRSHLAAFSDDGTRAAFTATLPTVTAGVTAYFYWLVIAQADGTPIRTLVGAPDDSNGTADDARYADPLWSPSGERVAFIAISGTGHDREGNPAAQTYELRVLDVASQIWTSLASVTGISVSLNPIRFSPGGDRILFSKTDANDATSLWSVQADGSDLQLLVSGTSWGDWQPLPPGS